MTQKMTGAQAIVQSLLLHGVDTIFGIPGVQTYGFFDALYEARDRIRVIHPRHEQATAYMAFGYAKATGRVGVFSVVPGPGVLNARCGDLYCLRCKHAGALCHGPSAVGFYRLRERASPRVAGSAGDDALDHEMGGAHRPSGRSPQRSR